MNEQQGLIALVKQHLRAQDHAAALAVLDRLIEQQPADAPLHWHRSNCLKALDRPDEALVAVQRVIELKPDFSKAWLERAELASSLREDYPAYESDVRRALALDPDLAPAHRSLALIQYHRDEMEGAQASLERALELDPQDGEGFAIRARWASRASWNPVPGEPAIRQFNGMELARPRLEQAVDDLQRAIALLPEPRRHRLQLVQRLHELQRFDEAVAECDRVLATLAADDPLRDLVLELRGRSSGQGAGERHQMAALLEQSAQELPRGRRSMEDDFGNAMARNVAQRLRNGEDIGAAVLQLEDGDPDTVLAMSVADKLHACGNHPLSQFRPARAQDFARHMRRFAIRAQHELSALGFEGLGDYEPLHLSALLSEPTLLRCYRSQDGSICAASYSVRPLWPGWIAWLVLKLKGLYQQAAIIDLETRFSDGHFLVTTNTGGIDPLGTGPRVDTESMPLATPAAALFERHGLRRDVYLREHPGVRAVTMMDMDAVIETQDALIHAKNAWRRSVGYVTDAELQQLLGERQDLAGKVRAQLALFDRESPAAEAPAAESPAMSFPVISIARPGVDPEGTLGNLIQHALTQGIDQVRVVGSPLHSFYLDERGEAHFLLDLQGGADPMTMALEAIQSKTPGIRQCALVVDSRITLEDGKKRDAIVVMACERGGGNGQTWAQCYIPKGWFKPFREHGERQQIGEAKNFIAVALADR